MLAIIFFYIYKLLCFVLDCGTLPVIRNGKKKVRTFNSLNSTHTIELSVEYECNEGYTYTLDNPKVNCDLEDGLDNFVGKCVKGFLTFTLAKNKKV